MPRRNTDGRESSLVEILRRQQLNDAYRNEGCQNSHHNSDGRTESLESILERALLEEAYKNDTR